MLLVQVLALKHLLASSSYRAYLPQFHGLAGREELAQRRHAGVTVVVEPLPSTWQGAAAMPSVLALSKIPAVLRRLSAHVS